MDFDRSYKMSVPVIGMCRVVLRREKIEEMKKYLYLGTAMLTWRDGRR